MTIPCPLTHEANPCWACDGTGTIDVHPLLTEADKLFISFEIEKFDRIRCPCGSCLAYQHCLMVMTPEELLDLVIDKEEVN